MDKKELLRFMFLVRIEQERVEREYAADKISTPIHMSTGQEAIAVGVCSVLDPSDWVLATYRGHAHYIAKGGSLNNLVAELFGKDSGCSRGRGGSMNIISLENHFMGTSAIVAGNVPIGVGMAFAIRRQSLNNIVVIFHGDGATEEGVFYESINYAVFQNLPVLFVCENNDFACNTKLHERVYPQSITSRFSGMHIKTYSGDGNDIFEVVEIASDAVKFVRKSGPALIEFSTRCMKEHVGVGSKFRETYFEKQDWLEWKMKDPLTRLCSLFSVEEVNEIFTSAQHEVEQAWQFAHSSLYPENERLLDFVYCN